MQAYPLKNHVLLEANSTELYEKAPMASIMIYIYGILSNLIIETLQDSIRLRYTCKSAQSP